MGFSLSQSCATETMMAVRAEEEEEEEIEECFFDTRDEFSSNSSCCSSPCRAEDFVGQVSVDPLCKIWIRSPDRVLERRAKFLRRLGWDLSRNSDGEEAGVDADIDRIMPDGGAVLRNPDSEIASILSGWSSEGPSTSREGISGERSDYRIKSLDDGRVFVVDEFGEDGSFGCVRELGEDRTAKVDFCKENFGSSSFVQNLMRREDSSVSDNSDKSHNSDKSERRRMAWLKRLGALGCVVDRQWKEFDSCLSDSDMSGSFKNRRVKVRAYRKRSKEFSAVFTGQDIKAHDGAILTMRFSTDGQYLATGGEDGFVRVWRVAVHERKDEDDLPEDDHSCIYFKVNHNSELVPLYADKEKKSKSFMRRSSDSACVVVPSEIFQIDEKPVHEFHGHQGDVLSLSWSEDKHLLSASTDKSARLWRVGCNSCLGVFPHSNYVTCLQFNPVNENYFISGCIDGKVRLWEIPRCRVVDWVDVKDIVTAVCYHPDGKAGVVGIISGDCRFFDASDNHIQLGALVSLHGKKKSPNKRITGFEFCPSDRRKLMVTSADSQVRILEGVDVVCKLKGLRNSGSQISASFTSDGNHIISASEDSNVYVWSHNNQDAATTNHSKNTWSCERFFSNDASVAIPWNEPKSRTPFPDSSGLLPSQQGVSRDQSRILENDFLHCADSLGNDILYMPPSGPFTLSQDLFSEFLPRGSATWPEEKLLSSSTTGSALCKSQYKFLKSSCQNASSAWGQVIVTAGWNGRIRSFRNYGLPVHQ